MDPNFLEKLNKKDSALDERLKNVYVTSEDRYVSSFVNQEENIIYINIFFGLD